MGKKVWTRKNEINEYMHKEGEGILLSRWNNSGGSVFFLLTEKWVEASWMVQISLLDYVTNDKAQMETVQK